MNTKPIIQVENVSKKFTYTAERMPNSLKSYVINALHGRFASKSREIHVLNNINFEIYPGEFVGIMGRNGVGKSTLFKLICGIYTPTSGKIEVRAPLAPLLELGAGFLFDLSGYENIFLNAAILGYSRQATLNTLDQILEFSELGDMIYMPLKNYSSGMIVRLGFSIATHIDVPILLVDEILAVGDAGFQKKCLDKIQSLHKAGRTIVLITHNPEAVKQHCDRCIVFSNQNKVFDGKPTDGANAYLESVC